MSRQKKTRRKKLNKKPLIAGTALVLAGMLGAGAFLGTSLSVQASAVMMPGIETIVGETSQQEPFRILEIVDDKKEAELGWYVSGQEPYVKLYTYTYKEKNDQGQEEEKTLRFSTLEEGLSMLPTKELREEFAGNFRYQKNEQGETVLDQDGNPVIEASELKDVRAYCYQGEDGTLEESFPLSYTPYQETYFLTDQDQAENWSRVEFSQIREDTLTGSYEENPAGTGDYTKQQQTYYPVRGDYTETDTESGTEVKLDQKENTGRLFRENIQSFLPAESEEESPGGNAPYHLVFQPVSNEEFNKNLAALLDPETASQDNPIRSAYDYSVRTDTNGDGKITSADAFGYGYFENKYEALTVKIMEHILPTETGKAPLYLFPGENPQVDGISGFQPTNSQLSQQDASAAEAPASEGEAVFDSGETTELPDSEFHKEEGLDIFSDMSFFHTIEMENHTYQAMEQAFSDSAVFSEEQSMEASQPENGADVFVDGETVSGGSENLQPDYEPGNPAEGQNNGADRTDSGAPGELFVGEGENPDAAEPEAQGQDPEAGDPAGNSQGDQEPVLLEGISEFATAGTQSNPKVYIADLIEEYPYYRYTSIGDLQYIKENAVLYDEKYMPDSNKEVNISISKDGRYLYWTQDPETENWNSQEIMIVTGRQPVAYENLTKLPESYEGSYYYRVAEAYFCCKKTEPEAGGALSPDNYQYTGWYYPVYPENQEQYLPVEDASGDEATYYISQAEYEFTPGTGNYDFVPSGEGETQLVKVDHLFYQGGYQNHDWLKQYVFHLTRGQEGSPEREEWDRFAITVDTVTAKEFQNPDTEGTPLLPLTEYDLVYVNGTLDQVSAEKLVYTEKEDGTRTPRKLPCMINQAKAKAQGSGINQAFDGFVKDESIDVDQHYVNTYVYFFKNTYGAADSEEAFSLFNLNFPTDFHLKQGEGGTDLGDGTSPSQVQGFEEILDYIKKENQYREVASAGGDLSDGTGSPETGEKIPPLTEELSQARAVEYILNYQYKRNDTPLETIRVLDLEPGVGTKNLTENEVLRWLGYETDSKSINITTCCSHNNSEASKGDGGIPFMQDGNPKTWWHSNWDDKSQGYHPFPHWIDIELTTPRDDIRGLRYMPRTNPTSSNGALKEYQITLYNDKDEVIHVITRETDYSNNNTDPNKAVFIDLGNHPGIKKIQLKFVRSYGEVPENYNKFASCAELSLLYDAPMVEITSMSTSEFAGHIEDINTKYDMVYLGNDDTGLGFDESFRPNENILYYHVGKALQGKNELLGLMDHDYTTNSSGDKVNVDAAGGGFTDPITKTKIGSVRGSGNDITEPTKRKLVDFAKSGYPVVAADQLYTTEKEINTTLVDNSSYVYDFLEEIKGYSNVYRQSQLPGEGALDFYINLPKPEIQFTENGTPPSAIKDANGPSGQYLEGQSLDFEFRILDESQASPANARYHCELYLDLNCDGNYSGSEQMKDIVVRKAGEVVKPDETGRYQLSLNTVYRVSRTVPAEYIKLIPWKLTVTNNTRSEIRASQIGYTKRKNQGMENEIRVLQIKPTDINKCNFNLDTDQEFQQLFDAVKDDFTVKITPTTVQNYENEYENNQEYLNQYHMLIIGFCDGGAYTKDNYGTHNFSERGVQGILDFANTGKSVIFAHDNTSSSNLSRDSDIVNRAWKGWAYYFNQKLRAASGMDRYGITAEATSQILKKASNLAAGTEEWNTVSSNSYDMAYELNSDKTRASSETQGFSNGKLHIAYEGHNNSSNYITTNKVTNVNEGAISEYPYKIDKNFQVAPTHFQYYQLALEEDSDKDGSSDIVVWYCLGEKGDHNSNGYYGNTVNDVRNNYYIYSYKNILYTGVGHSAEITTMEKKLFVNTIIAAYNAQAVNPELAFVQTSSLDSQDEKVTYYNLDYSSSTEELMKNAQEFHLKVTDNNLVGTSFEGNNVRDMKLELFVESESGEPVDGVGQGAKLRKLNLTEIPVYHNGKPIAMKDGEIYVNSGNVYDFTLSELEQYLVNQAGDFKSNVNLYAKISCEYLYYGQKREANAVSQIKLSRRQLFDLD